MKKTLIPLFVILQTYASVLPANDIDRAEIAQLKKQAKQQIEECTAALSNQRINLKSSFDSMTEIFTKRYPEVCIQTGLDWYQRRLNELAANQKELDDQIFRTNYEMLLSELEAFKSDIGQKRGYAEISISRYSTVFPDNLSTENPVITAPKGYINVSGK